MEDTAVRRPERSFKLLLQLFATTFKLGLFTFGGGYAIVPLLQKDFVENKKWIDSAEMVDIVALSQAAPGAIAVNASVFIGYRLAGVPGALFSALGSALPSLILLYFITLVYKEFAANKYVAGALRGIRAGVAALMIQAVYKLGKPALKDLFGWIFAFICFAVVLFTDINAVFVILGGGLIGWLYSLITGKLKKPSGDKKGGAEE